MIQKLYLSQQSGNFGQGFNSVGDSQLRRHQHDDVSTLIRVKKFTLLQTQGDLNAAAELKNGNATRDVRRELLRENSCKLFHLLEVSTTNTRTGVERKHDVGTVPATL